jgi:hypothetical protein
MSAGRPPGEVGVEPFGGVALLRLGQQLDVALDHRQVRVAHVLHDFLELESNAAYEAYRARGVMKDGRRFGRPADPHTPSPEPTGTINTTDLDSRIVRTQGQPPKQGYNAQAAVNENQIIVAAEVTVDSPDFGHPEPMVDATIGELERAGVGESPQRSSRTLATGTGDRWRTSSAVASRC